MVEVWTIGLLANATIAVAYLAVAGLLYLNLSKSRQWGTNPLGVGTFAIFLTCGGGHAVHTWQILDPSLGFVTAAGVAARVEYGEWHIWLWDAVTAIIGVWYWTMRRKFPGLVSGTAVFEDLRERQRKALEIHDNVVQGLARAKLALDLKRRAEGEAAVEETLEKAKAIITGLLGKEEISPGKLRRPEVGR